ncbi:hypothetical protein PtB15_17B122 [Puccinia triticina]|nr:hypothetical protein PtB15_17B122 [Puccinia triticina]
MRLYFTSSHGFGLKELDSSTREYKAIVRSNKLIAHEEATTPSMIVIKKFESNF